jgi:hypothetical protein
MDETRAVRIDPEHAERVVADFAEHVGLPALETYTPADAAELVSRHDYVCTPGTISEFIRKGYFGPQDPDALTPVEVYCLLGALESRRRWKPTPSRHDAKKSGARLAIEQTEMQGASAINDLDQHTVEDLLLQLTGCDNRAVRECLYEALRLKLEGFEE